MPGAPGFVDMDRLQSALREAAERADRATQQVRFYAQSLVMYSYYCTTTITLLVRILVLRILVLLHYYTTINLLYI